MRYASRRDNNHAPIRDGLRAIIGPRAVQDAGGWPNAGFDLIVRWMDNPPVFLEVKDGEKAKLTASDIDAAARYGDYWRRVESLEQAMAALGISTEVAPF